MAAEAEKRLAALKGRIEQGRQLRYRHEARLEELGRQRERLLGELSELGVAPERLDAEVAERRAELEALLAEAAALLPSDPVADPGGTEPLRRALGEARLALGERKGQRRRVEQELADSQERLRALREQEQVYEQVILLLQQTSEHARQTAKERIERLVTSSLQAVFGTDYAFRIELTERGGRPEAEFYVVSGSGGERLQTRPQDARGGGVVDVVSLALRIAMLEAYRPRLEGALILDEPAKHVSEDFITATAHFLKRVSETFGRQVIMVTHNAHLAESAEVAYQVVLREGASVVTRMG